MAGCHFSTGPVPIDYADGEPVTFDDTAVNPLVNISVANVSPYSITVSNVTKSYTISGNFGITGATSLTKQGSSSSADCLPHRNVAPHECIEPRNGAETP